MQNLQTTPATVTNKTSTPASVVLESLSTATPSNVGVPFTEYFWNQIEGPWANALYTWDSVEQQFSPNFTAIITPPATVTTITNI